MLQTRTPRFQRNLVTVTRYIEEWNAQFFNAILSIEALPTVQLFLTMLKMPSQCSAFRRLFALLLYDGLKLYTKKTQMSSRVS